MKNTAPLRALIQFELLQFFRNPTGILSILFFACLTWIPTILQMQGGGSTEGFRYFALRVPFALVILIPALTSGSWSSERRRSTDLLLLSFPLTERAIVLGKFLSRLSLYSLMLLFSMPLAFVTGAGFGQFFTVYLMLILYGGAALSLGIWIGLWVSSYIPSILITTVVLGLVTYLHAIPRFSFVPVSLHSFLVSLSFVWHFESAARGILDSRDIVFYGIPAVLFLMCGTLVLSNKRRQS